MDPPLAVCEHERCSGHLRLALPERMVVLATLVCDDCGVETKELAGPGERQSPLLDLG